MVLLRVSPFVLVVSCISLGCSDSGNNDHDDGNDLGDGGDPSSEVDHCCRLGAFCHVAGDDVEQDVRACHELGHENDAAACAAEYDACLKICEGVTDAPVEHACE